MDKLRAPRNRTLVLCDADRSALRPLLLKPDHFSIPNYRFDAEEVANRVVCADLMEVLDRLPVAFADLIIIDPPYNLTKDFGGVRFRQMDGAAYADYLRSWMPGVMRCLKPQGSVYVCCDWRSSCAVAEVLGEHATLLNRITWEREKGRGARHNWKNSMEDIWFAVADARHYYFDVDAVKLRRRVLAPYKAGGVPKDWEEDSAGRYRLTCPSNFWGDLSVPYWSMPENTDHPTQKPEKLMAKLILASCPVGGVVFDPFLGSGTSAVVAKKLGRRFCGVEMCDEYALLALKRLQMAETDARIQGYEGGVFLERNAK